MDIHIEIPESVMPVLETVRDAFSAVLVGVHDAAFLVTDSLHRLWELPLNAYVPILAVVLVFWPVLLSLVVAFASASTWIFWLFTSVLVGILQLLYATYQFLMIFLDIVGLSVLKTYSMIRNYILNMVDKTSGTSFGKSRRRLWRERLEKAGTYENYLKINIANKDVSKLVDANASSATSSSSSSTSTSSSSSSTEQHDSALPPILKNANLRLAQGKARQGRLPRAQSFTDEQQSPPSSPSRLPRSSSYNGMDSLSPNRHESASSSRHSSPTAQSCSSIDLDAVVIQELGQKTADLLAKTTERLNEARIQAERNSSQEAVASLKYLVAAVVKRNHLQLDNLVVENARSVAYSGRYGLTTKSRNLIRSYYAEVQKCLDWMADSPLLGEDDVAGCGNSSNEDEEGWVRPNRELLDRIKLVRKMKQNMGRTALMLSGGGAQAMYHLGIVRALIQSKLYDDIRVVSGTSGGSIIAAMCAIKTRDELFTQVCVSNVSTDFRSDGSQKKKDIRWFRTPMEMASYWLKNKLLMDSADFRRTCDYYYGDITFEEAFDRTGKHVCITVSASRASGDTAQRLLLNHISTPHVTLASAVAASCALPGVVSPMNAFLKQRTCNERILNHTVYLFAVCRWHRPNSWPKRAVAC